LKDKIEKVKLNSKVERLAFLKKRKKHLQINCFWK